MAAEKKNFTDDLRVTVFSDLVVLAYVSNVQGLRTMRQPLSQTTKKFCTARLRFLQPPWRAQYKRVAIARDREWLNRATKYRSHKITFATLRPLRSAITASTVFR